jgi:hypothetical protein
LDGRRREAEKELRRGLTERLAFYGREYAGYAYGLEPMADLLRRRARGVPPTARLTLRDAPGRSIF